MIDGVMKLSKLAALGVFAWGLCTVGCAGGKDATELQMDKFRSEVGRLRAENTSLEQRIENLEARTSRSAKRSAEAAEASTDERPTLAVVRLAPPESGEVADVAAKTSASDNEGGQVPSPSTQGPTVIQVEVTK